jgi:hypothetical protein
MITKADAVLALKPGAIWSMRDDVLEWQDDTITKPTDAEIKNKYDELVAAEPLNQVREVRNQKLAETDWTQSRDITLSNDADWKTYRQALRDITDSATSLDDVTWPEKP